MEHLTRLPKREVGTILSVGTFNHERVSMSCLQCLDALKATVEPPAALKSSPDGTQYSECHHDNRGHGVPRSTHRISYVRLWKMLCSITCIKLYAKLAPGWALIQVNFDPIQEIGPKVEGGLALFPGLRRRRKDLVSAVRACT